MKTAISLPEDVLARLDEAARRAGLSRSEFFRNAGLRYAEDLAAVDVTARIDAYVEATGDDGSDAAWARLSHRSLAAATQGDTW
jgi:metal-responsive CopG/Arc/MetJ family transcriptional regulator